MGGVLSLLAVVHLSSELSACVPFYGLPPDTDFGVIKTPIQGHFAEIDDWITKEKVDNMKSQLKCPHEIYTYQGAHHAFTNETRPEVYDAKVTQIAMDRTMVFFGRHLF